MSAHSLSDTQREAAAEQGKYTLGQAAQLLAEDQYTRFGLTNNVLDLFETAYKYGQKSVADQLQEVKSALVQDIKSETGPEIFAEINHALATGAIKSIEQTKAANTLDGETIDTINMLIKLNAALERFENSENNAGIDLD